MNAQQFKTQVLSMFPGLEWTFTSMLVHPYVAECNDYGVQYLNGIWTFDIIDGHSFSGSLEYCARKYDQIMF